MVHMNKFLFSVGSELPTTSSTVKPHYPLCITSHCCYGNMHVHCDSACWLHCRLTAQKLRGKGRNVLLQAQCFRKQSATGNNGLNDNGELMGFWVKVQLRHQHSGLLWTRPGKVLCSDRGIYRCRFLLQPFMPPTCLWRMKVLLCS